MGPVAVVGNKISLSLVESTNRRFPSMIKLLTISAAATVALTLSTSVLASSVGVSRNLANAQPNTQTIAALERASDAAQREAREGNKNNLAFAQKRYEIYQLVQRLKSGQQVAQMQVDEALQPVRVW
jgi:hypothetical protein